MSFATLFKSKTHQEKLADATRCADSDVQKPTIYFIRHGEKPPKLDDGNDAIGLSEEGKKRAEGIAKIFGRKSKYNIGYILAQQYKPTGARKRAHDTMIPLSQELGVPIDHSIDRDNVKAVVDTLKGYDGNGSILVCWEHHALTKIMKKLGVEGQFAYPKERFDVIWTVRYPYKELHSWKSQGIDKLDQKHRDP